ncbi:MAG TPA: hypothetical protein VGQ92_09525 [Actinoplanes sp.]|nr:hypothetical protein [Actinoplanes sp.]
MREREHASVWFTHSTGPVDSREIEAPEQFGVVKTERLRLAPTTRSAFR